MTEQAPFTLRARNPDVLTCIANLSNDEVFTPPEFANRMLDTLAAAWAADQSAMCFRESRRRCRGRMKGRALILPDQGRALGLRPGAAGGM